MCAVAVIRVRILVNMLLARRNHRAALIALVVFVFVNVRFVAYKRIATARSVVSSVGIVV